MSTTNDSGLSQGDYFAQVPESVLRDEALSCYAKTLYGVLLTYPEDSTFPGQERLAKQVGCCPKTVSKAIKELVAVGLVVVTRRGQGKTNLYKVKRLELRQAHNKVEFEKEKEEVVKADCVEKSVPFKKSTPYQPRTSPNTDKLYSASNNKYKGNNTPYNGYKGNGDKSNYRAVTNKPVDFSKFEAGGTLAYLVGN